MADISWSKSMWQGDGRTSGWSVNEKTGGTWVEVNDLTALYDSTGTVITESQPTKDFTIYLGTGVSSKAADAPSVIGVAKDSALAGDEDTREGAKTYAFGTVTMGVNGTQAYVKSLKLTDQVSVSVDGTAGSIVINSNAITELVGSSKADDITVKNFGSTGTINLGAEDDSLTFNADSITTQKITVDGGAGNDAIVANNNVLTYKLASYGDGVHTSDQEADQVGGFAEKSTIVLASGRKFGELEVNGFSVGSQSNDDGGFVLNLAEEDENVEVYTEFAMAANASTSVSQKAVVNFVNDSGTREGIIYGSTVAGGEVAITATEASTASLYVGAMTTANTDDNDLANGAILKFGAKGKKNIFLGHQEGTGEQFGDTSLYVNVKKVSAATDGATIIGSLTTSEDTGDVLINGGADVAVSLCGIGGAADTLQGYEPTTQTKITTFGTLTNAGTDVVTNYHFGNAQSSTADKILFIDGLDLSKTKATTDNKLYMGVNANDGVAIDMSSAPNSGNDGVYVQYLLGIDSKDTKTALIDVKGGKTLEFDTTKATTYVGGITGQAADQTTLNLGTSQVSLGFDADCFNGKAAKYQSYGMSSIDGSNTAVNSIINGSADNAETVQASKVANSFICGGFAGEFADTGADTLIGSGSNTISTEFFVGKDLGSDTILNLSSLDKINFINTAHTDVSVVSSGNSLIATAGATKIVATCAGSSISDIKDVTFQFTDGAIKWTGSGWQNA